jgi:hypothetical protein
MALSVGNREAVAGPVSVHPDIGKSAKLGGGESTDDARSSDCIPMR